METQSCGKRDYYWGCKNCCRKLTYSSRSMRLASFDTVLFILFRLGVHAVLHAVPAELHRKQGKSCRLLRCKLLKLR